MFNCDHSYTIFGKYVHRFYKRTKFIVNNGVVQKKTNAGRTTWMIQSNEKNYSFFLKTNDLKSFDRT